MTKKKKIILPILLAGALAAGSIGAVLVGTAAENAPASSNAGTPAALLSLPAGVTAEANVAVPDYMLYGREYDSYYNYTEYTADSADLGLEAWNKNGVKVTPASANRWVEYANVVDISDFTYNDVLFAFTPLATARGNVDFNEFNIKLTDAENEENYLLIKIKPSQWFPSTFSVETAEMGPMGYQYGDYRPAYNEGMWGFNDKCTIGFDGTTDETAHAATEIKVDKTEARHRPFILHYDYEDKALCVTGQLGLKFCIMDLDWSESVGYGKEWDGFSSGKVKLSFCSKQHRSGSPSYMVLNAFNQPMYGASVTDAEAPVLSFGSEVQGDTAPAALAGREYRLPVCTALDTVDGAVACSVTLKDPNGQEVSVQDGAFTPAADAAQGFYTAQYTAQDKAGNVAQRTLRFTVQQTVPQVTIDVDPVSDTTVAVGEEVTIPNASFTAAEGGYLTQTQVRVLRGTALEEVVDASNATFIPLFAGEYRVQYVATDWLGFTHTQEVVYTVTEAEEVTVHGSLQHLRRLFDGVRVVLPKLYAYDYVTTPGTGIAQEAQVTLSGNGQSETLAAGSVFTPDLEKFGSTLTVSYQVNGKQFDKYEVEIYALPDAESDDYVNDGAYQLDSYFQFDDGVVAEYPQSLKNDDEQAYFHIRTQDGQTGKKEFSFVNPLQADGFTIVFSIPKGKKNFTALTLSLRDSFDQTVGFDLRLSSIESSTNPEFKNTYTYLETNGGKKYAVRGVFDYGTVASSITIIYRDGCIYDLNGTEVCKIQQNFDGKAWKDFASGMVYLDVAFEGVGSLPQDAENGTYAAMSLSEICGQACSTFYSVASGEGETGKKLINFVDIAQPLLVMDGAFPMDVRLGQKIELRPVTAYDALSPYVEVAVTVQAPDGTLLYAEEPYKEGMNFTVDSYGTYSVLYTATDASGNTRELSCSVGASDTTAPTLALSSTEAIEGSVGSTVRLPAAIVQDNRDEAPRLFIYVIQPDASSLPLGEVTAENKITGFKPETAGSYTIVYYAIDADYNATVVTVPVTVK